MDRRVAGRWSCSSGDMEQEPRDAVEVADVPCHKGQLVFDRRGRNDEARRTRPRRPAASQFLYVIFTIGRSRGHAARRRLPA